MTVRLVQVAPVYPRGIGDPDSALAEYPVLTRWAEAALAAGAAASMVVLRFPRDATLTHRGVTYRFVRDGAGAIPPAWHDFKAVSQAVAALEPGVVHLNGLQTPRLARRLRQTLPRTAPLLGQDHGGMAGLPRDPLRRAWLRAGIDALDGVLFTAATLAGPWQRAGLIRKRQSIYPVLEAGTDFAPVEPGAARERSMVAGDPALLWVGRLDRNKDPLTVLDGFEPLLAELPKARLSMVFQSGRLQGAVRARIHASPALWTSVLLIGPVEHALLPAYYSAADFLVLGSHHESTGFAVMEALACGALPVVTDLPAFRMLTDGGRLGRHWPPGKPAAFAEAVHAARRLDRRAMRAEAIQYAEANFRWAAVGQRALTVYQQALAQRQGRDGT